MDDPGLPDRLEARLSQELPGSRAHLRLAPLIRKGRYRFQPPADVRRAAVVALLYPGEAGWTLPLTLRPDHLSEHAGQICFPGGRVQQGESSAEAALRELAEELGPIDSVRLLGTLSDFYVYNSNHLVTPHVAVATGQPRFEPCPDEVAEILEVSLDHLLDPETLTRTRIRVRGVSFTAPCYTIGEFRVWGATSMMLAELVEVLDGLAHSPRSRKA